MPSTWVFASMEREASLRHGHNPTLRALHAQFPPPRTPSAPLDTNPLLHHDKSLQPRQEHRPPSASLDPLLARHPTASRFLRRHPPLRRSPNPWATPPLVGSPVSRGRSSSVKARAGGRRMHSRWDQTTPKDAGPNQDWSTSVKTLTLAITSYYPRDTNGSMQPTHD